MYPDSRFQFSTGALDAAERLFIERAEPFRYLKLADNIPHVVQSGDTLFSLAGRYYAGEPRAAGYWWVIGHFQPEPTMHDPTIRLTEGTIVIVPSLRTLRTRVLNASRRREE